MIPVILTLNIVGALVVWGIWDVLTNPEDWAQPAPELGQ